MFTDNRKKQIEHAKRRFRNHKAKFKQFDGISTLDWRNVENLAIDMPTLKAINKQCQELGWIE